MNTERVRKGQALHLNSGGFYSPRAPATEDTHGYMMVSLPDAPFGKELVTPAKKLWPFGQPAGFSDEEVVELVDFARGEHDMGPIVSIDRQEDGSVEIRDGVAGEGGTMMRCEKKEGKWVVVEERNPYFS